MLVRVVACSRRSDVGKGGWWGGWGGGGGGGVSERSSQVNKQTKITKTQQAPARSVFVFLFF